MSSPLPKILVSGLIALVFVSGCSKSEPAKKTVNPVVQTSAPGEATLEFVGEKVRTKITRVTIRKRAIAGDQFSAAGDNQVFLTFEAEVENVGKKANSVGGGYTLKTPDGKVAEYTGVADGEKAILFDEPLGAGDKKSGTLTWEVPTPKAGGKYLLLWKPNPLGKGEARFTYVYRAK
ncbi:MAG: DUF4352 domain-containing protein [Actinomycetota bacterium]